MRALVKSKSMPGLWLHEVPRPTPGDSEVLIRILRTGICGTDLHIYDWDAWALAERSESVVDRPAGVRSGRLVPTQLHRHRAGRRPDRIWGYDALSQAQHILDHAAHPDARDDLRDAGRALGLALR